MLAIKRGLLCNFTTTLTILAIKRELSCNFTTTFIVLAIKSGLLCNFTTTLNGRNLMGHCGTGLKFSITIDL